MLIALLAVGGLVWALTRGSGATGGSKASGSASVGTEPTPGGAGTPQGASASGATGAASVGVTVAAERDHYAGPCPAPAAEAPAFTATFTVDRVPATVVYRWVTRDGGAEPGWRTLRLTGSARQTVRHGVTDHRAGDPAEDWAAVEVRSPRSLTSRQVPFTWACEPTPTGGASPSGSPSAFPSGSSSAHSTPGGSPSAGPSSSYGGYRGSGGPPPAFLGGR
ncbi:hypothetical protein AB0K09_07350 [Streptomyces sp. NPDC049577]|uniref:hypothetical protein n=1 Tax=Streptomyces sp. NPDC049577 TaxID=3155153 RepID=UPI00342A35C0